MTGNGEAMTPAEHRSRIVRSGAILTVFKHAAIAWYNDNVPRMGASLSYYTLFSLAPILVISIAVAGLAFGEQAVRGQVVGQIQGLVGRAGAEAVQAMLEGARKHSSSVLATVVGAATFFLGATGVFLELQTALNAIWRVEAKPSAGIRGVLLPRLISFGLVMGVGFLLLVSLLVSAALAAVTQIMGDTHPTLTTAWGAVNALLTLAVMTLLFGMIYKVLPDIELEWRHVWVGALVTAGLFSIGKFAIGLYLGTSSIASSYGAAGSVVVLLVWVYYTSQIVLLGAEFTRAWVEHFGKRPPPMEHAKKTVKSEKGRT
jgi:membrane protein